MEQGGAQYGRCAGVDGVVDGRKGARDGRRVGVDGAKEGKGARRKVHGRREVHGCGRGGGGKIYGRETGGAWVWTAVERKGRETEEHG